MPTLLELTFVRQQEPSRYEWQVLVHGVLRGLHATSTRDRYRLSPGRNLFAPGLLTPVNIPHFAGKTRRKLRTSVLARLPRY